MHRGQRHDGFPLPCTPLADAPARAVLGKVPGHPERQLADAQKGLRNK